ncbi:MAG: hemolysin III family protein [Clostridium sp.]|nr:hemolysin III family protein [Clostridium sp.]
MSKKYNNEEEKIKRREEIRKLSEPPVLTILEEVGNSVTHGIGAALAIAGMVLLLVKSNTGMKVMASCFYGISLFLMMLMSSLYHAFKSGSKVKRLWRRFDYSSIYLLIGGTFAPLYLVYWGNTLGITLFCIAWFLIICGIVMMSILGPGRYMWVHFTLFFTIGWSGLMFIPDWFKHNRPLLWMILIGGILYTIGMVPFSRDKKYNHFIWHFFVLAGAILHWFGIYLFLY